MSLRFARWLYALCWTGTERPGALFERATAWLLEHKVLLPGVSVLERFVAKLRQRVEVRLWRLLCHGVTDAQRTRLESLIAVPASGGRSSLLDQPRSGPAVVSGPSLVKSLLRLDRVREFDVRLPPAAGIPPSRLVSLARYANSAKASAVSRLPPLRRLVTLVAFVHTLEATAQDDALEVLEQLLQELFADARKADQKSRLRSLKDLDAAATVLAEVCSFVLDEDLPSRSLRSAVFKHVDPNELALAMAEVLSLVRPDDDVFYYLELLTCVLFELIAERYERKSIAITANTPFSQWGEVFVDAAMTVAAVDRLVHHSTILEMNVESYRRRTAQAQQAPSKRTRVDRVVDAGQSPPKTLPGA